MFNFCFASPYLCILAGFSSFLIIAFRKCLLSKVRYCILYYFILIVILFIQTIGGGGVINDDYKRLKVFEEIESNHQLQDAKNNPHKYNNISAVDLSQFANSQEFKDYIHKHEKIVDRTEAISMGLIFAIIAELSNISAFLFGMIINALRKFYKR